MKAPAVLPQITADQLRTLRAEGPEEEFLALVLALRDHGWPLRALADETNVSRVAVNKWQNKALTNQQAIRLSKAIFVPRLPVLAHGSKTVKKRIRPDLSEHEAREINALAKQARNVQRWSRPSSPEKRAATKYEALLRYYHFDKKVSVAALARHAGVTRRAISQRLEKAIPEPKKPVE